MFVQREKQWGYCNIWQRQISPLWYGRVENQKWGAYGRGNRSVEETVYHSFLREMRC